MRFLLTLLLILATATGLFAAEFRVGFASADITPPIGWRRAGNYTELISTGVNDPLKTKAMVVQEGATTFAFVGNDLCSVPRDLTDLARLQASKVTGIPVANIVITATHTHGGPEYLGPLRQFLHQRALKANNGIDPHEPIDYRRQLVERWADVIAAAWSNRQPASLEVVIPRLEGIAFNRRYWMKDGSTGWIPRKGDTNIFRPAGPVDTDFPFLLARRAGSTEALGSLAVFAMHTAVYGGPAFGADFPGHLQTNLTAAFGPKFVSILGEGCAGDVNHLNPFNPDPQHWTNVSPAIGRAMAQAALREFRRAFTKDVRAGVRRAVAQRIPTIQRIFPLWRFLPVERRCFLFCGLLFHYARGTQTEPCQKWRWCRAVLRYRISNRLKS